MLNAAWCQTNKQKYIILKSIQMNDLRFNKLNIIYVTYHKTSRTIEHFLLLKASRKLINIEKNPFVFCVKASLLFLVFCLFRWVLFL